MSNSNTVVIVNARNIFPFNGGDKIVSFNLLKKVSEVSGVVYINIVDERMYTTEEEKEIKQFTKGYHSFVERFVSPPFDRLCSILLFKPFLVFRRSRRKQIATEILKILNQCSPTVVIWDQLRSPVYYLPNSCKNFIIEHNDEVEVYYQKAIGKNWLQRQLIFQQARILAAFSSRIHDVFDRIIYLSNIDRKVQGDRKFTAFNRLLISFFHKRYTVPASTANVNLLFVGSLDWYPNYEGITWFIQTVMPLLPPAYTLTVVGRNAPESIYKWCNERVKVHSNVVSVEEYFLSSHIFISPVFVGSGINIKILEAASYGIPIVSTPHSTRGYDGLKCLIATDEDGFCNKLLELKPYHERYKMNQEIVNWYAAYQGHLKEEIKNLLHN